MANDKKLTLQEMLEIGNKVDNWTCVQSHTYAPITTARYRGTTNGLTVVVSEKVDSDDDCGYHSDAQKYTLTVKMPRRSVQRYSTKLEIWSSVKHEQRKLDQTDEKVQKLFGKASTIDELKKGSLAIPKKR